MLVWYLRYAARCVTIACLASDARARFRRWAVALPSRGQLWERLTPALRGGKPFADQGAAPGVALGACC